MLISQFSPGTVCTQMRLEDPCRLVAQGLDRLLASASAKDQVAMVFMFEKTTISQHHSIGSDVVFSSNIDMLTKP